MKFILLLFVFCFTLSAFAAPPAVGQWELRLRGEGGFTSYGFSHENGKALGFTNDLPVMLPVGGSSTLAGLSDVALSGVANLHVLQYNSGSGRWENEVLAMPFGSLTGVPTTLAGHGITDSITAAVAAASYQSKDTDLTRLATLTTTGMTGGTFVMTSGTYLRLTKGDDSGSFTGGNGGSINMIGEPAAFDRNGGSAGSIQTSGGNEFNGGNLSLNSNGLNDAGSIDTTAGGSLTMGTASLGGGDVAGTILTTAGDGGSLTNLNGAQIQSGTVGATQIASTTVTAGSYTSTNLTVDADGRITAASSGSSGITLGTTTSNGTAGRVLYTDGANVQAYTITGTGSVMMSASPTSTGTATFGTVASNTIISVTQPTTKINVGGNASYPYSTEFGSFAGHVLSIGKNAGMSSSSGILIRSDYGIYFSSGTNPATSAVDVGIERSAAGVLKSVSGPGGSLRDLSVRNFFHTEYIEGTEMTAPAAPAANKGRLYFEDNGSGKTRLMVIFPSGAAQQIAIEP